MQCEYIYCIYNRKNKCLLKTVSMNNLGMCDDCMTVSLEENFLEAEKERQLQETDRRWETTDEKQEDILL